MGQVESGQFDSCDIASLGSRFEPTLQNLCLAWHLKYLSGAEISSLDPSARKELGWWLPPWQWNVRLVPLDKEVQIRQNDLDPSEVKCDLPPEHDPSR